MEKVYVVNNIFIDIVPIKYVIDSKNSKFITYFKEKDKALDYQICSNICSLYSYIQVRDLELDFNNFISNNFKIINSKPVIFSKNKYIKYDVNLAQNDIFEFLMTIKG